MDCSILLKYDTEFDDVTYDTLHVLKVKESGNQVIESNGGRGSVECALVPERPLN